MSGLKSVTLGELTWNRDAARRPIRGADREFGDTPYLGASGVVDRVKGFTHDGHFLMVAEDGENLRSRSTPIAWTTSGRIWANNHVHVLEPRLGFDGPFLQHLLSITDISGYLTGSTLPKLTQFALARIALRIPPPRERERIAEVLGALDDKIAANAGLVTTVEELAALTFAAMPRPESVPLSETARFVNGRNFTKDASNQGRVVIRIAELNSGLGGSTVRNDVSATPDNLAAPGDLLFAWSGSLTVKRWFLEEGLVNQHIFKVIPNTGYPIWLVHQLLLSRLVEFRSIAADKATTMGHIQRRHLDAEVSLPSPDECSRQDALMEGLWHRALAAEVENVRLATLRDTLLPELMSGRLRVKDAERAVEDAL